VTAKLDPAQCQALIEQVRAFGDFSCGPGCSGRREECPTRIAGDWAVDNLAGLADQIEAALARTAELEQLVGNLEHILGTDRDCATLRARVRSAHAQRDDAREECERLRKLVDELRCGDLDAFHDGGLSDERRVAFEAHLVTCAKCQAGLQDLLYLDAIARGDEL
jgi:hypothetical protein